MKAGLYSKLAWQNLRSNRRIYLPYICAQLLMVALFYNVLFLAGNKSITQMPGGETVTSTLGFGSLIMGVFAITFLVYINSVLIKQRKREFGLYIVLGMEKRHLRRVVFYETGIASAVSIVGGIAAGVLFSGLLYVILLNLLGATVTLDFSVSFFGIQASFWLFFVIFLLLMLYNWRQIGKANPRELLQSSREGEREPKTKKALVVFGVVNLLIGYFLALMSDNILAAMLWFFVAVVFVIIGTHALFTAGSIAALKKVRADKARYYTPRFFTAVSGLLYRMKQNAAGLANICILSSMILVTCSVTFSVYAGQEAAIRKAFPTDLIVNIVDSQNTEQDMAYVKKQAEQAAAGTGAEVTGITLGERYEEFQTDLNRKQLNVALSGSDEEKYACYQNLKLNVEDGEHTYQSAFVLSKQDPNEGAAFYRGVYGGFLFLGLFLGAMFMVATVLIIYYKQVSEGYEDRERYTIMRKVGMSDEEIRGSIRSQVLLVFFLPLATATLHILVALKSMVKICAMLQVEMPIVLICTACVLVVFALIYAGVYTLTARTYFNIVNQKQPA